MKKLLLVIDMQNDFIDGALGTKEAEEILPAVIQKVKDFDGDIIFTRDTHFENYLETQEGKNLPVSHCIKGSTGWELAPELDLMLKGEALSDFVTETGESGGWTYRKWHSGMAECWKFTQIQINVTTAAGSLYYSDLIPIQLPFAMTDVTFTGSVGQLETLVNPGQPDAEHINFRVMRCTQHSYNTDIALLVKGRWKEAEA